MHPARDWFALLSFALLLIGVSVGWNIWLLDKVERGEAISTDVKPASIESAPVDKVEEVFKTRKEEEQKYRQTYRFVDPSVTGG